MKKIVLATANTGKIEEFRDLFNFFQCSVELLPQSVFTFKEIEETGLTFVENALLKARHASTMTGLPTIADDSGLAVSALKGAPGIFSARYAGKEKSMSDNIAKLLQEMEPIEDNRRHAIFHCCLVYLRYPTDPAPIISQAKWEGSLLRAPQGRHGFGYDPIVWIPSHGCSAAELPSSIKNQISHRAQALRQLLRQLNEEIM